MHLSKRTRPREAVVEDITKLEFGKGIPILGRMEAKLGSLDEKLDNLGNKIDRGFEELPK